MPTTYTLPTNHVDNVGEIIHAATLNDMAAAVNEISARGIEFSRVSDYIGAYGMTGTAIQAAMDASVSGQPALIDVPGNYTLTTQLLFRNNKKNVLWSFGGVTVKIDPTSALYLNKARTMLKGETPVATLTNTNTTAYTQGQYAITVTSTTGINEGDLIFLRLTTTTNPSGTNPGCEGEIRMIRRVVSSTVVWLDIPLVTDLMNNASGKTIQVFPQRTFDVRGVVFDTVDATLGNGAIHLENFTRCYIADCKAIGGGKEGIVATYGHYALVERCESDDFSYTDFSGGWTDPRTSEFYAQITQTGSADCFGEAYAFCITATHSIVRDCRGRKGRHNFAAGQNPYQGLLVWYDNCKSESDMQGGFDWHSYTQHAVATNCVASGGDTGFVLRGDRQTIMNCEAFDETVACKTFEFSDYCRVNVLRIRNCTYGLRLGGTWNLTTHYGAVFDNVEFDNVSTINLSDAGNDYYDFVFRNCKIISGGGQMVLKGAWHDLVIENWTITGAPSGSGISNAIFYFQADDNGAGSTAGIAIRNILMDGGSSALPPIVYFDKATTATALVDGTYTDVTTEDITVRTSGTAPPLVVVVAKNATAVGPATGGSTTTVVVSGATWTTNQFIGQFVYMTSGSNVGLQRRILSNTATTLTTDPFPGVNASGNTFSISASIGGFFNRRRIRKNGVWVESPPINGAKGGNTALTALLAQQAAAGEITDLTT